MNSLIDCSRCACLIEASESACPFCGASVRGATAWSPWLGLALAITLGAATAACGEKGDEPGDTQATTMDAPTTGTTDAGSSTAMTVPDTFPDGATYAGPDEDWTTTGTDTTTTTTTTTTTMTTIDPTNDSWPDASTYGGPDESTSTSDSSTSTSTGTSTGGSTGDSSGDTSGDTSDSSG